MVKKKKVKDPDERQWKGSKYWLISNMFYFSSFIRKNEIKGEELKESLKNA